MNRLFIMTPRYFILLFVIAAFTSCDLKSADTYLQESKLAGEKGDYKNAINLLSKAIHKSPQLKAAYIERGLYYEDLHHEDSAINDYKTLLSFDAVNTMALYHLGFANLNKKSLKKR